MCVTSLLCGPHFLAIRYLASRLLCTQSESKVANRCNLSRLKPSRDRRTFQDFNPPPATRHPSPVTRHPPSAEKSCRSTEARPELRVTVDRQRHGLRLKLLTLGVGDSLLLPLFSYCVNVSNNADARRCSYFELRLPVGSSKLPWTRSPYNPVPTGVFSLSNMAAAEGQHSLTQVERPSYLRSDFVNV